LEKTLHTVGELIRMVKASCADVDHSDLNNRQKQHATDIETILCVHSSSV